MFPVLDLKVEVGVASQVVYELGTNRTIEDDIVTFLARLAKVICTDGIHRVAIKTIKGRIGLTAFFNRHLDDPVPNAYTKRKSIKEDLKMTQPFREKY